MKYTFFLLALGIIASKSYFGKKKLFLKIKSVKLYTKLNFERKKEAFFKDISNSDSSLLQEEHLFKYPISTYSADVDEITNQVEPFYRLFNIVLKWQKAEKKYGSQSLMELSLRKSKLKYYLIHT